MPGNRRVYRVLLAGWVLSAALGASAAVPMVVLHGDFERSTVRVESIDGEGLRGTDSAGQAVKVPLEQLIAADASDSRTPARSGKLVLLAAGGRALPGEAIAFEGETIQWKSDVLGAVSLPLSAARRIVRDNSAARLTSDRDDVVRLANGDVLRGAVASADAQQLKLQTETGETAIAWNAVVELALAQTGTTQPAVAAPAGGYRIELAGGTIWEVDRVALEKDELTIGLAGAEGAAEVRRPAGELRGLERQGGAIVWLARQSPLKAECVPFLARAGSEPALTVLGPTRAGDEMFRTALRVRPASRLVYSIPAGVTHFRTRYAQQKEGALANVTVRILADGKVLFEQRDVSSASPAAAVNLALGGARELTLEVGYGANFDVEDALLWLDPVLMRASAASQTTR